MHISPKSLEYELLKFITEHPYIYGAIKYVGLFALGMFVKKPLELLWKERNQLTRARRAMYVVLAEICAEVQFFSVGIANPNLQDLAVIKLVQRFYERIKALHYDKQLKDVCAVRTSIVDEVEGFELIIENLEQLPSLHAPIQERLSAAVEFSEKVSLAMFSEQFDLKEWSFAFTTRQEAVLRRRLKTLWLKITDASTVLQKATHEVDKERGEIQKVLDETKAKDSELDLKQVQKVLDKFRDMKAKSKKIRAT